MQPKFTRKKVVSFLRKALVAMCFGVTGTVSAQVLSTASGTGYGGDLSVNNTLPLNVSFVVQNTTGAAVALTDVSVQLGPFGAISFPGDALTTKLFVSTTSLSGTYDLSTAAWTQIATGSAVVPAAVTVTPVITGASFVLPAGAQYRFVIECTKGLRISGPFAGFPLPTPNSFTNGGLVLKVGDNKIGGLNVGWGGLSPSPTNEPTFFGGTVTFISTVPCAGTPAPGLTQSTATTACPTIPFTLSLQNPTTGSGVSYQWQVSTTGIGGSYTDIPGATAATYSTTLTVASCYRARVICASPGGGTGTSTPICVALTPASGCYCTPPAMDCTDDDEIIRVRFSTLDNPSTCGTGPPAGYSNFTALPAPTIYSGAANPITVDLNGIWSKGVGVWIDYNRNGAFEASEFTNIGSGPAATTSFTTNINIPASALSGTTRMRVRTRFGGVPYLPGEACTNPSGFGETEDYNVNIQPCVPVTFSSNPSSTSISCGSNASFSVTTNGSLPAYRWEYRPNATAAWQFVPSAAPYSGENTATLTLTNVSQAFDGFQYRATATGGCSGVDVSAAATLTVTALVPVVNPASATICLGTVQPLTLTNTLGNVDLLTEGFNTMLPAGWNVQNLSQPLGTTSWFQGNPTVFPAQSGPPNSYAGANFEATTTVGTISSWLITPQLSIKNGDVLTFWSRANDGTSQGGPFADRMEVRMSTAGASTNVGATATSFGDFSNLLLTINSGLTTTGYPFVWTQYTVTVSGLGAPTSGRFAFRYFVTNAGSAAANSDFIGVDNVKFTATGGAAQGIWTGPAGTMWTNPGATTAYTGTPATTIYVNPTVNSNYQVSFTTLTPCTSATTTVPVNVTTPVGTVTSPVNRTVCSGTNATFTASATGGPLTYQWQVSTDAGLTWSNISGATSGTLTVSSVTTSMTGYRYRAVITAAPCTPSVNSNAAILTVNSLPTVAITAPDLSLTPGQTTTVTATSSPAAAANGWTWTLDGSAISGTTNTQVVNVNGFGTYRARVVDVNGCIAFSNDLTIGAEASDRLWIYPNPSSGAFQVRLYYGGPVTERRVVRLFKSNGQLVMEKEFTLDNLVSPYLRMDFDLSNLASGTYVVKVNNSVTGKITSGLVVIQHD